eukprot:jgi/Chlat1/9280/Chrsp99S08538
MHTQRSAKQAFTTHGMVNAAVFVVANMHTQRSAKQAFTTHGMVNAAVFVVANMHTQRSAKQAFTTHGMVHMHNKRTALCAGGPRACTRH